MKKAILICMALVISATVFGQRSDNAEYWNTWEYKAKDGMTAKFMEAAAEKTARFNSSPENAMMTYRVMTGRSSGTFVRIKGNMKPVDYDIDRSAEGQYWNENVGKYIGTNRGLTIWRKLNNGSHNFEPSESGPSKYFYRTYFDVKPDKTDHFRRFMDRIAGTLKARNWEGKRGLFRLESGGSRHTYALVIPFDTFKRNPQPEQEKSFSDVYEDLYGYNTFDEDRQNFRNSLENWGEMRETLVLVPEMTTGLMK
jgi:hypothetical protein